METIIISIIILEVIPWDLKAFHTAPLGAAKYIDCVYKFSATLA